MFYNLARIFRVCKSGEASCEAYVISKPGREQVPFDFCSFDGALEKFTVQTGTVARMDPPILDTIQGDGLVILMQITWNIFPIETVKRLEGG